MKISKSILRNTILTATVMVALYIVIVIFSLNVFVYFLNDTLDSRLKHELEKIAASFKLEEDKLVITDSSEFAESDFVYLTGSPFFLQIYNEKNKILLQSRNISLFHKIKTDFPNGEDIYYFRDETSNDNKLRVAYQKLFNSKGEFSGYIQIATPKDRFAEVLDNIIILNGLIFPAALLFIFAVSYWIAKKSFSPIKKIIAVAERISATNLSERIQFESDAGDDLTKLKNTLNSLFERLEDQIKRISEFTDNASHQMMTPLTALNTEIEYLLKTDAVSNYTRESLLELKEITEQMIHLIKSLLLLSRDSGINSNMDTVFNLSQLLRKRLPEIYKKNTPEIIVSDALYVRGNDEYFLIAIQNLVDNGLKYSGYQKVIIEAKREEERIIIKCIDAGIGIDESEKEKIFERFYRSETAERLGIKGYGLGLSLVKFIIKSMGGTVQIENNFPKGTTVTISLPLLKMD